MVLTSVQVTNFRSIKTAVVNFTPPCRIFVGINESGKSNLIKALALLKRDTSPSKLDVRQVTKKEKPIELSEVNFEFMLEQAECESLIAQISATVLGDTNKTLVLDGKKCLNLMDVLMLDLRVVYEADIRNESKRETFYGFKNSLTIISKWKKPSASCPPDYKIGEKLLTSYSLIDSEEHDDIPPEYLDPADIKTVQSLLGKYKTQHLKNNHPDCVFWEYKEENILPVSVPLESFIANPDSCVPLKNMFNLAGYENISEKIREEQQGQPHALRNLLEQIADNATSYFRTVWKEYKEVSFGLILDGSEIKPYIKDSAIYDMSLRSDGFKRFCTFLLLISTRVKTGKLKNTLILIDEPDISLHPTGARFLRDELIRISEENYVAYSTHSLFMIDNPNLGRHYIVKKKKGITEVTTAQFSNITDEEVIYNAIGYSAFFPLKEKNLLFEGWNDKNIFRTAMLNQVGIPKAIYDVLSTLGTCHAKGVANIDTVTPMLDLAMKKCFIISDADNRAKDEKIVHINNKAYGTWYTYEDIQPKVEATTGEDFLEIEVINDALELLKKDDIRLKDLTIPVLENKDRIHDITAWLIKNKLDPKEAKAFLNELKRVLFCNLIPEQINSKYFVFLEKLAELMK